MSVTAVGLFGLLAIPASATGPVPLSTTVDAPTTDPGATGGNGIFIGDAGDTFDPERPTREYLKACDRQADGLRVYAEVQWGRNNYFAIEDADGASGGECNDQLLPNITEEADIYLKVCLKDGPNGRQQYCNANEGKA